MRRLVAPLRRHLSGRPTSPTGPTGPTGGGGPSSASAGVRRGDEGVAMMMVILVMLVTTALLVVVTAAVIQRIKPTQLLTKNTQTLSAADTGLDAALSQIRTAAAGPDLSGKVFGAPTALPCTIAGNLSADGTGTGTAGAAGSVGLGASAASGLTYTVVISYYAQDPTGQDAAWRTANQLTCTPGSGVSATPRYALLTSTGSGAALAGFSDASIGNRVLEATYAFKVTNANIAGGLMYTFAQGYCVQADSAAAGSALRYVAASGCSRTPPLQLFQWDSDYRIRLSATTAPGASPLCITGVFIGQGDATLQPCGTTSGERPDQLFAYEGGARFRGQSSDNTAPSNTCLWAGTSTADLAGQVLQSGEACWWSNDPHGSWAPEPKFGAGAASKATDQIVNYQQFGRCFDITNENIKSDFVMLYPCKQDPSGRGGFLWNHKIYYSNATTDRQQIKVLYLNRDPYCLTAPPVGQAQPAWPRLSSCVEGQADQQWVRTEAVPNNYAASYTFTDTFGRCLGIGPLRAEGDWSTIVVAPCDGTASQKWNAPPDTVQAGVSGLREDRRQPWALPGRV